MKLNQFSLTGPFTYENLSVFVLCGKDGFDGSRFIPLDEALEHKCVVVHETGNVGQLEVENLSEVFDLFIQAGDVVKGGRQDRTMGVDFVLPPKWGRVPIPTFCVESGRWHRRAAEDAGTFSSSMSNLSSKNLLLAAKLSKNQGQVWDKVAEMQQNLSESMNKQIHASASPTSYQLSVEDVDLQKRKEVYRQVLRDTPDQVPDAIGYVSAINGAITTADVYGSGVLFRKLWSKLLDAAVLEAISEAHRTPQKTSPIAADAIRKWFTETDMSPISDRQEVPPRVCVETRRSEKCVVFDTRDHGHDDSILHRNFIVN